MPATKVSDEQLASALSGVFREYGFEGATLTRISDATGLKRASLYHRFPGGKEEMSQWATAHVAEIYAQRVLSALQGKGTPRERAGELVKAMERYYDRGKRSCVIDTLSLRGTDEGTRKGVAETLEAGIAALAGLAHEAGFDRRAARRRAEQAMAQLEGALVLARATGNASLLTRLLAEIPAILTER